MPFILRNSKVPFVIGSAGALSSAVQCVFVREYLAIFSGNEGVLGLIFSIWLCATAGGSLAGTKSNDRDIIDRAILVIALLSISGLFCIRAGRLLFTPGELIGPLPVFGLLLLSEAPFAFANGYLFGALARHQLQSNNPYGLESFGALAGAVVTFFCVLLYCSNITIVTLASAPFVVALWKKPKFIVIPVVAIAAMFFINTASLHWKYQYPFSTISYGREGEIVSLKNGNDETYMLNGTLYKSSAAKPSLEQAVHVPLSTRPLPKEVLVIFDKGHYRELSKYPGATVDCIESEPRLASPGSIIAAPESFRTKKRYDAIFLGSGIPQTAAAGRFYTVSFFTKMKALMTDSGIFSFTLPLSENYLSTTEKRMSDVMKSTLCAVFKNILVFPGNGYTFMASDKVLKLREKPYVRTEYLETSILPFVTPERIAAANEKPRQTFLNTAERPLSLLLGLNLWLDLFKGTWVIVAAALMAFFFASAAMLPKSKEVLSMGSTGFAVGIYSVALLLLYQSTYGLLYSRVSLLLCCLTLGFVSGTLVRRLPLSDLLVGAYCLASLGLLSLLPYPPSLLFYVSHFGVGVLAGAQFKSMKKSSAGALYAADCVGGALGMALTVIVIPLYGIIAVAGGLFVIKGAVWVIGMRK